MRERNHFWSIFILYKNFYFFYFFKKNVTNDDFLNNTYSETLGRVDRMLEDRAGNNVALLDLLNDILKRTLMVLVVSKRELLLEELAVLSSPAGTATTSSSS